MPVTISAADFRQRLLPILLSQGVGLACGIVGVRLVSELVAPADYGVYGVFVSIAPIGATVIYAGLVKFISRHWGTSTIRPKLLREILVATARKSVWLALACGIATVLVSGRPRLVYAGFLFASALLLTLLQFAQSALQSARDHWRDFGVSAAVSLTRSFGPALLYATTGLGLIALFSGFTAQALVGAILGAVALRQWWRVQPRSDARALTDVYDGPRFVILAATAWIMAGLHRWIVAWRFGSEVAGYFTLGANVGAIVPALIGVVLLQYFQPQWFADTADSTESRRRLLRHVDRVALGYTAAALLAAGALKFAMPLLIGPLISARYANATAFVLATGCAATALMVGTYYHAALIAAHRELDCSTADLSGAACLTVGAAVAAFLGLNAFTGWLVISPVVPWVVNRTFARRALLRSS